MIISKEVYKYTIFKQCWGEQVKCRQEEGLNKGAQDVTHPGFIIISIQVLFPRVYELQVLVFVISWTPYTVMATWDTLDKAGAQNIPGAVQAMAKQRLDVNF